MIHLLPELSREGQIVGVSSNLGLLLTIKCRMKDICGGAFSRVKIKNKLKTTRANYVICKNIILTSDFSWDTKQNCLVVNNDV